MNESIPKPEPLGDKPLVEAIFEIHWELTQTSPATSRDPGFRLFLSRYYDKLRTSYPHVEDLPVSSMPEDFAPDVVRHRFRAAQAKWPLTQLGPGVLTVNETEGYLWTSFEPRLLESLRALFDLYPKDIAPLKPTVVQLRYIDAIPCDGGSADLLELIAKDLHISVALDPALFGASAQVQDLDLNLTYPLSTPPGVGKIALATGYKENKPHLIMQTTIRSEGPQVPVDLNGFTTWLRDSHDALDRWFFTLVRGRLLDRFKTKKPHAPTTG
jgi:uncharacterized protein (TIGR04255 family)